MICGDGSNVRAHVAYEPVGFGPLGIAFGYFNTQLVEHQNSDNQSSCIPA